MKITSLFADKPYSAIAIAICFAVLLSLPWLHLLSPDSAFYPNSRKTSGFSPRI